MTALVPGVYGMRLLGVAPDPALLAEVAASAPTFEVVRSTTSAGTLEGGVVHGLVDGAGSMAVRVEQRQVEYRLGRELTDDELVHPWLAPAAAAMALHDGQLALHGAVLEADGRCVAVLGDREAGKSTLVAAAAARGLGVMTDDVIVLDALHRVHAGPRCIDLRPGSAEHFAIGSSALARSGTRHRISLPAVPSSAALAAIVVLAWGSELRATPLLGARAAQHLLPHVAATHRGAAFQRLLDVSRVPHVLLARPRDFGLLEVTVDLLAALLSAPRHGEGDADHARPLHRKSD